jgi:hypothetical protein
MVFGQNFKGGTLPICVLVHVCLTIKKLSWGGGGHVTAPFPLIPRLFLCLYSK